MMLLTAQVGVDWKQVLQTFGLAITILAIIGLAIWKVSKWVGAEIVIPVRDRAIKRFVDFLDKIEVTVGKLDVNVDSVTSNLQQQTASLVELKANNADGTVKIVNAVEGEHGSIKANIAEAVVESKVERSAILNEIKELRLEVKQARIELAEIMAKVGRSARRSSEKP